MSEKGPGTTFSSGPTWALARIRPRVHCRPHEGYGGSPETFGQAYRSPARVLPDILEWAQCPRTALAPHHRRSPAMVSL